MRGRGQRPFGIFPKIHLFWYHYPSLSVLSVKSDRSIMSIICVLGDLSVVFLSEVVAKCLNDLLEKPQWWYLQGSWMMYISNLEGLISYNPQIACVRIWRLYDQMCAHCRVDHYEWHYNELLNPKGRFGAAREAKNHYQAWMESTYVDKRIREILQNHKALVSFLLLYVADKARHIFSWGLRSQVEGIFLIFSL